MLLSITHKLHTATQSSLPDKLNRWAFQYTYQRATAQLKNNSMHLLMLNSRVPRTSLGLSFQRDLLYTAAKLPKKVWGVHLHGFLYRRGCPVNDVGYSLCHLTDIHCDMFYITVLQCWYRMYRRGSTGRNHIMEGKDGGALPRPEALTLRSPVQKGQPHVTRENTITHV